MSALRSKLGQEFKRQMIDNNLLKVEIYYKEFNFEKIKEIPGYPVKQCITAYKVLVVAL